MTWESFRKSLDEQIKLRERTYRQCDMANHDWEQSAEGLAEQAEINALRATLAAATEPLLEHLNDPD